MTTPHPPNTHPHTPEYTQYAKCYLKRAEISKRCSCNYNSNWCFGLCWSLYIFYVAGFVNTHGNNRRWRVFGNCPWTCPPPAKWKNCSKSRTSPKRMFFIPDFCVVLDMNEYTLCASVTCTSGKFIFPSQLCSKAIQSSRLGRYKVLSSELAC